MNQCSTWISVLHVSVFGGDWHWNCPLFTKIPIFSPTPVFYKESTWYDTDGPLRQARLTTKLPLFNTKIPFFLANASFLQRKHAIWYRRHLRRARLTTKLLRSYFVQIKLVALLSTIQYQKFSPTRHLPTRICDNVATENGHCWYSTFFSKKF